MPHTHPMGGLRLEASKFAIYLITPVVAVLVYSTPAVHEWSLRLHRYIVFPPPEPPLVRPSRRAPPAAPDSAVPLK